MAADVVIGAKLEADASGAITNVKSFKKELQLAQAEVVTLSEKFGATSKEAAAAAKRAAELKDAIGDAKSLVDAFNPDTKFRAFGASISTVVGGFAALTGAMGLLGVESEEVQKTLLKVQSALALSQGIAQLQEGMQAFKNLGTVITQTLGKSGIWGVAIAAVGIGIAYITGLFDGASVKARALNDSIKDLNKGLVEATKDVAEMRNAFKQAELGIITKKEALDKYNSGIGKTVGFARDLDEAEKLMAENAPAYIKVQGLKAQANFILGRSSELEAKARINQLALDKADAATMIFQKDIFQSKIDQQKADAAELQGLIAGINNDIAKASAGFKSTTAPVTAGATGKETPASVKAEQEKINLEYSTAADNRLQRLADFQTNWLASNKIFLDAAAADEQAAFNEKIALLNLELDAEDNAARKRVEIERVAAEAKTKLLEAAGNALMAFSDLLGTQTAAGKIMAVAATTINTYAAIAASLRAFAGVPIPGYAIVQAIATGLFGLAQVRKILTVNVPGKSSGGSVPSLGSVSAPLRAVLPTSTNTRLDRDQLNQIGNASVRAFLVESDVTSNQERIRRINRAARIG